MIFYKNIVNITLLYCIYHLVCLKQINIFHKDFSIKKISNSTFLQIFFFNFYNPSRRYRSINVTCLPHKTERACAFLSLGFFFFFFFFSRHKNYSVFRSHRMIFVTFYLLEAISQSHNDLVTLILRSLVFTFSLFWSLQRKVQNKLTSIIYDLM